ncbi:MAG: hypothetical protein NC347_12860, partial [Clostridium sp.]|nr:hypothetical protein [Clostridium sp.]
MMTLGSGYSTPLFLLRERLSVACYIYCFEVDSVPALDDSCFTGNFIFIISIYKKTPQRIAYDYQWRMDESDFCNLLWGGVDDFVPLMVAVSSAGTNYPLNK